MVSCIRLSNEKRCKLQNIFKKSKMSFECILLLKVPTAIKILKTITYGTLLYFY